jgi:hypothetical protein
MGVVIFESYPSALVRAPRRRGPSNCHLRENVHGRGILICGIRLPLHSCVAFFDSAEIVMAVSMPMSVSMSIFVMVMVSVGVSMVVSTEYDKADKVGHETKASNNEDEDGLTDDRWVEESGEGLEDDGYAKGYEEDGIEEGAQDFSTHPLQDC